MKVLLWAALLLAVPLMASTAGEFRGTVVQGPEPSDTWLYVEGHDHGIRRVDVSRAKIRYGDDVPAAQRKDPVPRAIPAGVQVRVTAEQDAAGEWRASEVEILGLEGPKPQKNTLSPTTSQS